VNKSSVPEKPAASVSMVRNAIRDLKRHVRELRALLIEATSILDRLLLNPSAEIIRWLCSRYYVLQESFVLQYAKARNCAIAALGAVEAAHSFPIYT